MTGLEIARIDLWHVAVPLPAPFHPSWIPGMRQVENRFDLLRITTGDGHEGWSAGPAMGREREGLGDLLGPYLLGERADDLASIRQRIREMGYLGWRVGWIEPAFWDVVGKARGKPVWELLGGTPGRVRFYASTGEVRSGAERVREVEARLSEGFAGVKLRVHAHTLEEDLDQVRAVGTAAADRAVLGVDANQGWRVAVIADAPLWDFERALRFCDGAAEAGFTWVEEPLPMDAYEDLARLTAATSVQVTGGELNHHGLPELRTMIERRCFDKVQPDAVMVGGIAESWAIARVAARHGVKYTPHTWTNGIGFAANLHLFAATPGRDDDLLEYPLDPPGWVPEARDGLLVQPWLHERGSMALPTAPGLGFEIDRRALRRHARRYYVGTRARVALRAVWDRGLSLARHLGETRQARLDARREALAAIPDPMDLNAVFPEL